MLKEIIEKLKILHLFNFLTISVDVFLTEKVFMNGNQSLLNRFSTSCLNLKYIYLSRTRPHWD